MVLWFLRCLFVLLLVAVSFMAIASDTESFGPRGYMLVTAAAVFSVVPGRRGPVPDPQVPRRPVRRVLRAWSWAWSSPTASPSSST